MKQLIFILILCGGLVASAYAQPSRANSEVDRSRINRFLLITGAGYSAAQVGLYSLWYKDQQRQSFTFFNDAPQWKQVDKIGHAYSTYHLGHLGSRALINAGMPARKSYWYGALMGKLMLLPVEFFDAYSEAYGFSWADVAANTAGAVLLPLQYEIWQELRVHPKFSFQRTDFAPLRPATLGNGLHEEIIKDYNGQTYWLSFDLHRFLPERNFPKWLNLAVGYGAENMLFARDHENQAVGLEPYRQWYLALDLDLSHYRREPSSFGNKLFNGMLYLVNLVHLPAPTLAYEGERGFRFYPFYF